MYYYLLQAAFRALAGKGYQTLQSLLLDFCQLHSSEILLDALLDMLVDGKFNVKMSPMIKVMYQYIGLAFNNCLIHLHCFIFYSRKLKKVVSGGPDAKSYLVLWNLHSINLVFMFSYFSAFLFWFQNEDVIILYLIVLQKVCNSFPHVFSDQLFSLMIILVVLLKFVLRK